MKKLLYILSIGAFLGITNNAYNQAKSIFDQVEYVQNNKGKVRIVQDDNLKALVEKHQLSSSKMNGIMGFRIRIFSDSGSDAKNDFEYTKALFSENFGEVKIHQEFDYPFYKIYIGDFRSRSDALKLLKQIEWKFPDAFIVQTRINYPKLKTE